MQTDKQVCFWFFLEPATIGFYVQIRSNTSEDIDQTKGVFKQTMARLVVKRPIPNTLVD